MSLAIEYETLATANGPDNGDGVCVRHEDGVTLFAVVDGLGHGPGAAVASRSALEYLGSVPLTTTVLDLISGLDAALRSTRGAAAMVCRFENGMLESCGVGNVEMRTVGAEIPTVLTPGILGRGVNNPKIFRGALRAGARLLVFSDGISTRFAAHDFKSMERRQVLATLMTRFRRDHDDASVLVADMGDGS